MIRIYGASDDLVEIEGDVSEELNPPDGKSSRIQIGSAMSGGCVVRCGYALDRDNPGVWSISVEQIEEGTPIPWPVSIKHNEPGPGRVGYSAEVVIDCPPGTPVLW